MIENKHRYFIVNKPYKMVSQFISSDKVNLLGDLNFDFPEGIHAVGRLDNLSEGLLILTTNKKVTKLLFESKQPHTRTYLVQVLNKVNEKTVEQLRNGVLIKIQGNIEWLTTPCKVAIVQKPTNLFTNSNELSSYAPHTWLSITLTEGKYHQVRKMVFAVKHKCKRLIRTSIEDMMLGDLQPGCIKEFDENTFFQLLKIKY
jgi:23S rRNA pseudouridine2457 synthase